MAYIYSHESLNNPIRLEHSEVSLSELDVFSDPPVQKDVIASYWEKIYCQEAALDPTQKEVAFECKPSMDCISLADSYLEIGLKLQKKSDSGFDCLFISMYSHTHI